MGSWTLDDIPWQRFDRAKLDPDILRIVKAASLVEHNGAAYAHHLCRIFSDDPAFQETARRWGEPADFGGIAACGAGVVFWVIYGITRQQDEAGETE